MVHGEPAKICCATYAIERPTELRDLQYKIIDRDLLNLTWTLEVLLLGAADACASVSLLVAAFCELLALIDTGSTTISPSPYFTSLHAPNAWRSQKS